MCAMPVGNDRIKIDLLIYHQVVMIVDDGVLIDGSTAIRMP